MEPMQSKPNRSERCEIELHQDLKAYSHSTIATVISLS